MSGNTTPSTAYTTGALEGALHDIANSLTVAIGWLSFVDGRSESEHSRHAPCSAQAIRLIRQHCMLARSIATDALDVDSSGLDRPVECVILVCDALEGLKLFADQRGVDLRRHIDDGVGVRGICFASQAQRVLENLLINAITFSPRGTCVTLSVSCCDEKTVGFVVTDEGPGFSSSVADSVFSGIKSTIKSRNGIGLRHAFVTAQKHGGALSLLRAGPGAVLELRWPSVVLGDGHASASNQETDSTAARLVGTRVLLLEDDEAVSGMLSFALGVSGVVVEASRDLAGACAMLEEKAYDAILVDVSPLGSDVAAAIGSLRGRREPPKLVLITGSANPPDQAVVDMVSAWVRKPFGVDDIMSVLARVCRHLSESDAR